MRSALFLLALGSAVAAVMLMAPARRLPPPARILKAHDGGSGRARGAAAPPAAYGRVPDFTLRDHNGRAVRRDAIAGPWLASFLFTRCSGQCPMLAGRLRGLEPRLKGVRLVSFSVDPADTPAELRAYAARLGAGWTFLTGAPGQVERLAREGFKLPVAEGSDPREPILHSSRLALVDAAGLIRGYFDASDPAAREELVRLARTLRQAP